MEADWGQLTVQFVTSLIASLVSVAVVLWVERKRKPELAFTAEENHLVLPDGRRFLRVLVHNTPIHRLLGFFVTRHPALMCRAYITFLREDNLPVFHKGLRMKGRWSCTAEPSYIVPSGQEVWKIRDPSRTRDDVDIPPNSYEILDIAMRAPGNDPCFGWHNDFIENPSPRPDDMFELPRGRYHVLIRVRTGGEDFTHVFRIVNDMPIEHFRLEQVGTQPKLDEAL